jgi:hypothetical protein
VSIYTGDDERLEFTVYQSDGSTALDLAGMDIVWEFSKYVTQEALITKDSANSGEIDVVDAANGRFDVILNPTDTADLERRSYYHEVELTDGNGKQFTVFTGSIAVELTLVD